MKQLSDDNAEWHMFYDTVEIMFSGTRKTTKNIPSTMLTKLASCFRLCLGSLKVTSYEPVAIRWMDT